MTTHNRQESEPAWNWVHWTYDVSKNVASAGLIAMGGLAWAKYNGYLQGVDWIQILSTLPVILAVAALLGKVATRLSKRKTG